MAYEYVGIEEYELYKLNNSVALVREGTLPVERPSLVDVSAKF
jgi:hypothetical protein